MIHSISGHILPIFDLDYPIYGLILGFCSHYRNTPNGTLIIIIFNNTLHIGGKARYLFVCIYMHLSTLFLSFYSSL